MIKGLLTYGEMFCGPGGLAKGAMIAGAEHPNFNIKHSWATDIDTSACQTYAWNICGKELKDESSVINKPIDEVDIKNELNPVDIFAFGFPCNDFSLVGEKKGLEGSFGPLYTYAAKYLTIHKPKIFVAENVSGLKSANEGKAFELIIKTFIEAGYNLNVNKYDFHQYGVPQKRSRIIITGARRGSFNHNKFFLHAAKISGDNKSCYEAISTPPITNDDPMHKMIKHPDDVVERLSYIDEGENVWNAKRLPERLKLKSTKNTISQIYRRLKREEPSYTVTGSGGGGTHIYHWKENRALTNRERARLQTFDDDYKFFGGKNEIRKQIGMAVPVDGAKIIFKAVLDSVENGGLDFNPNLFEHPNIGTFDKSHLNQIELF